MKKSLAMAKKIERQEQALSEPPYPAIIRYVFFDHPPELWMADNATEGHVSILKASGREYTDIISAGFAGQFKKDTRLFDGSGSGNLQIKREQTNIRACVNHLKSLPSSRPITFEIREH